MTGIRDTWGGDIRRWAHGGHFVLSIGALEHGGVSVRGPRRWMEKRVSEHRKEIRRGRRGGRGGREVMEM